MRKIAIRKICYNHQQEIDHLISKLLFNYDKRLSSKNFKGYVTDTYRGRAYIREAQFTVPLWASKQGSDYFTYYTAHEMSHIISWRKNHENGAHDRAFYEVFKKLCPCNCQKYELSYKKRAGISYGVPEK